MHRAGHQDQTEKADGFVLVAFLEEQRDQGIEDFQGVVEAAPLDLDHAGLRPDVVVPRILGEDPDVDFGGLFVIALFRVQAGQEAEEVRPGAAFFDDPFQEGQRCFGLLQLPVDPDEVGQRPKVAVGDRPGLRGGFFRLRRIPCGRRAGRPRRSGRPGPGRPSGPPGKAWPVSAGSRGRTGRSGPVFHRGRSAAWSRCAFRARRPPGRIRPGLRSRIPVGRRGPPAGPSRSGRDGLILLTFLAMARAWE